MKELIKAWLHGAKHYAAGVALYKQYGSDTDLLNFFLKDDTPFRRQRLQEVLEDLVNGQDTPTVNGPDITEIVHPITSQSKKEDPVLLDLHQKKVVLHREKDDLRAALEDFETDEERGQAAFRILDIRQAITGIWEAEEYYKKHGRLPVNTDHLIIDLQALKTHRSRINGNLRRCRAQLKKSPNDPVKKQLQAKWEAEYTRIKQSIKQQQEKK